jgi:Ca-activated chloride channel family protein
VNGRGWRGVVAIGLLLAGSVAAADRDDPAPLEVPPPPATPEAFLAEVAALISPAERRAFLALAQPYQREQFIRRFWAVRDPFPQTASNEFEQRWRSQHAEAERRFPEEGDQRRLVFTLLGEPTRTQRLTCAEWLKPMESWRYDVLPGLAGSLDVLFYQPQGMLRGRYELIQAGIGIEHLLALTARTGGFDDRGVLAGIASDCAQGELILQLLARAGDPRVLLERREVVPQPSDEWLATFVAYGTDLPPDAAPLAAQLALRYPGRWQSRTVVQGVVLVERAAAAVAAGPGGGHAFLVDGEILRQDELFDQFRYRFAVPARPAGAASPATPSGVAESEVAAAGADAIPLLFERRLRPGSYRLLLRVQDTVGERFFRTELALEVPVVTGSAGAGSADTGYAVAGLDEAAGESPPTASSGLGQRLAEADAALGTGDWTLELLVPQGELLLGKVRLDARLTGEGVSEVRFSLDGREVMTKRRPPFSVELDLGGRAGIHTVAAVARDAGGRELASDEVLLNAGAQRFGVRLLSPERGKTYRDSLRAQAEVEVPEGERLERLELYLDETLLATLYQPPFTQPIVLPPGGEMRYVRAVAYLDNQATAEDVVLINAPDLTEELEVRMVELYTAFFDRRNRPVADLAASEIRVFEDEIAQEIRRFEAVENRPFHAVLVLDTSASMDQRLGEVERAALRFFEQVVRPQDRAALVTFADQPNLAVRLTSDLEVLAGGLAGMTAEGETALWDSLVFSLHYVGGLTGRRAVIVLTDGDDVKSRHRFEDVVEYARRLGIAVYPIGVELSSRAGRARSLLVQLAEETGGQAFFIARAGELGKVYQAIEEELRAQILISYQSSQPGDRERYRRVRVEVARPGVEARTMRGYYP